MFYSNKIVSILENDKVLEVGPGSDPHPRSNVLLEINASPETLRLQRGNTPDLITDKKIVYYDGSRFPFKDKEFDYVICSHVIEHVTDPKFFFSEVTRVAHKGYIEFPTIYYEYLYNFDVHLNIMKYEEKSNTIYFIKKNKTPLQYFKQINDFFIRTLELGYSQIVDDLNYVMIQGFEWNSNNCPTVKESEDIKALTIPVNFLHKKNPELEKIDINTEDIITQPKRNLTNRILHRIISRVRRFL